MMSYRERFMGMPHPLGGNYAPSTIGCSKFIHPVDNKVFKKTKEEKLEAKIVKSIHKKELTKCYPEGIGRNMNVSTDFYLKVN